MKLGYIITLLILIYFSVFYSFSDKILLQTLYFEGSENLNDVQSNFSNIAVFWDNWKNLRTTSGYKLKEIIVIGTKVGTFGTTSLKHLEVKGITPSLLLKNKEFLLIFKNELPNTGRGEFSSERIDGGVSDIYFENEKDYFSGKYSKYLIFPGTSSETVPLPIAPNIQFELIGTGTINGEGISYIYGIKEI